jgi:hypothetical protein
MIPVLHAQLGCVACEATGPASGIVLQMVLCGAVSAGVLLKLATEDALRPLRRRAEDETEGPPAHGASGEADDTAEWLPR